MPSPLLKIEGPPGSGKTRELAREACRLIAQDGIAAHQISVLCTTPLGKRQFRQFLKEEASLAGLPDVSVEIMTVEAWLLSLLEALDRQASKKPQLLQESDAQVLLQEVLRETVPPEHPLYHASRRVSASRLFFNLIRQLQLKGLSPASVSLQATTGSEAEDRLLLLAKIYSRFQTQLQKANLICPTELASQVFQRLTALPKAMEKLSESLKVLMVDEAQELSPLHHQILALFPAQLILAGHGQLSIRSFRGATPDAYTNLGGYYQQPVTFVSKQACMRGNEAILSLLNQFLPQPIWEEQVPDVSQLKETVKFGFYTDPAQEAEGIALFIQNFVRTASVQDRAAAWDDCVILLRSSHYRQHLIHAFSKQGIPFHYEALSKEIIRFQQTLYDLLQVVAHWQTLNLDMALLKNPVALKKALQQASMSVLDRDGWLQAQDRHLFRWLEAVLSTQHWGDELRRLHQETPVTLDNALLLRLAQRDAHTPAVSQAYRQLVALYGQYQQTDSIEALLDAFIFDGAAFGLELEATSTAFQTFRTHALRLNVHYTAAFHQNLPLSSLLQNFQHLWESSETFPEAGHTKGGVQFLSIHQAQGQEFPLVVIPFLVNEEFPHVREMPEVLSDADSALLELTTNYRIDEAEESRLLAVGMTRASQLLILTCHRLEAGTSVLPSAFYERLLQAKRKLLNQEITGRVCRCEHEAILDAACCETDLCALKPGFAPAMPLEDSVELPADDLSCRYVGTSEWAKLDQQAPEPLFEPTAVLDLSASSIKTYMTCPRQFYYKHLLRLPQPGNEAASLGTLMHRVMEIFNREASRLPYTFNRLYALAESLFLFQEDPDAFYEAGFTKKDEAEMLKFSPLSLASMKQRLLESVRDLEQKGYFDRYGTLKQIEPEKRLEGIMLEGLENCRFSGSMDALVELRDGTWEIIDYKTFRNAYKVGVDTCEKNFRKTLDPLPDDASLSHAERFADKLNSAYPKDYQLPLYYLACRQNPLYADKLRSVSLQILRPAFPDKPEQGSIRLEIEGAEIEAQREPMLEDIQRYIISPILESEAFAPVADRASCGNCAYYGICEAVEENDANEGGNE